MTERGLKATLHHDLTEAMRAQDKVRAGTLRMVLTAVTTEEVAGTSHRELSEEELLRFWVEHRRQVIILLDRAKGSRHEAFAEQFGEVRPRQTLGRFATV